MQTKSFLIHKLNLSALLLFMYTITSAQQIMPAAYSGNMPVSFVRSWDATSPQVNPDTLMVKSLKDVKQATQYFDGLGRPLQSVIKQGSLITGGTAYDMVSPSV